MNLRTVGVAVAVVLAMACKTSGSNASGGTRTSSAGEPSSTQSPPSGATAGQDPLMQPGPDIKGHASDQVVSGSVGRVSSHEVAIVSDLGDTVVLEVVPETAITIEGMDADSADLQEGQPVRASFNNVEGQDVAVEIRALPSSSRGSSGSLGTGSSGPSSGSSGTGSSGSSTDSPGTGSSGSSDTGSSGSSGSSGSGDTSGSSHPHPGR
jgi:hypothetical protein